MKLQDMFALTFMSFKNKWPDFFGEAFPRGLKGNRNMFGLEYFLSSLARKLDELKLNLEQKSKGTLGIELWD